MVEIQQALDGIPDKTYFRIGEVAKLTGVKAYVLRFWETEFKMMTPPKSRSKQRMYRRRDIETILKIKHLLYERRFTIRGARRYLLDAARREGEAADARVALPADQLVELRRELGELRRLLAAMA
jgi:DNA-binding transcriptional MerR regulator